MVILRFRVSLCCTLGSILSCIFGLYSDLPPPVPLVPVFPGPPNYGNLDFFVAQVVFSSTTTVGFQLPSPLCKVTEPLHYRPHEWCSLYCVHSTVNLSRWTIFVSGFLLLCFFCFAFAVPTSILRVTLFPGERPHYDVTTVVGTTSAF